ncbi:hypothetical protein GCM10028858_19090 [Halorubrum pallidum]
MTVRNRGDADESGRCSLIDRRRRAFVVDERARVPFALIGVLLLVSSSAYAAGVADQGLIAEDRSVERAVERAETDATAALRTAARETAHAVAAEPVTAPSDADGGAGAAVRDGSAFEDAFRIRLAIAGDAALSNVTADVGAVTANASLPPVDEVNDLISARERVRIAPVANGTAVRVTFEAVTTTANRNGRTVVEETTDRTVVVAVPTLAAHERTERFEARLDRGPVEGPGLGRQVTASLYATTWARGYGQYGGAPIENVLANRHVELSTNAGIVRVQRDVFGASDPAARGGVARATARTGVVDLLEPTGVDESAWTDSVLSAPTPETDRTSESERAVYDPERDSEAERTSVTVGHAADVGAVTVHDDVGAIADRTYRVTAALRTSTTQTVDGGRLDPPRPDFGEDWVLDEIDHDERTPVVSGSSVPRGTPTGTTEPGESRSFGRATRAVSVDRTAKARWERTVVHEGADGTITGVSTRKTTTYDRTTDRYRVRVDVTGRHAPTDGAPDRPAATFGSGGRTDGPDLRDAPGAARSDLDVDTDGGVDRVARAAVEDGSVRRSTTVHGDRSDADRALIANDVSALSERVRDIETSASMEAAAVGEAEPYADLADAVRDRRGDLIDAPETYDGSVDRARTAARAAFVDAVVEELESAAADREAATTGFFDRVNGAFDGPPVGDVIASREAARDPGTHVVAEGGPGGPVTFAPTGSPGYLPRTAVDGADVPGLNGTTTRPLAVRNINYVTVPYGDVSAGIVDRLIGTGDTVRIETAGRALRLADDVLAEGDDPDLRADRDVLAGRVDESLRAIDLELAAALRTQTSLTAAQRRGVLARVSDRYDSVGDRAVAVGDGTYPDRVATEAAAIGSLSEAAETGLAARLRVETRTAAGRDAVRIPARFVEGPTDGARLLLRDRMEKSIEAEMAAAGDRAAEAVREKAVEEYGEEAVEKWEPKPVRRVGAGLPVAPVPGYWVATVNAWRVQIRGEYPRFALRADVGTPGSRFEYVREEGTVAVDVGGTSVSIGKTEPVRFETSTVVVVAVPAGPPGVGDVDGVRDETSSGWPCPGPMATTSAADDDCTAS